MDSRLLNVFHDDPFDGSFINNTDLWSAGNDIGLQLTETLNGILPITADKVNEMESYGHSLLPVDEFRIENKMDAMSSLQNEQVLLYDELTEDQLATDSSIEIITVDPNAIGSDSDDLETEDDDDTYGDDVYAELADNQSQCSDVTFRTRTDSSSIGDYESHTSDYESSDDEDTTVNENKSNLQIGRPIEEEPLLDGILPDVAASLLSSDDFELGAGLHLPTLDNCKNRTISTNTISSDVDVNNFDLAEYITNDSFSLTTPDEVSIKKAEVIPIPTFVAQKSDVRENTKVDTDSDSDVIVDIETVETDIKDPLWKDSVKKSVGKAVVDITYADNVKADPSWSPKLTKKNENLSKESKQRSKGSLTTITAATATTTSVTAQTTAQPQQNNARSFSIIPSKRQCTILKGKSGQGKGKNLSKYSNGKITSKKVAESTAGQIVKAGSLTCRVGVGQGGKNLALIEHNKENNTSHENTAVPVIENVENTPKHSPTDIKQVEQKVEDVCTTSHPVKRKLNLEEYKKRRENPIPIKHENKVISDLPKVTCKPIVPITPVKHSEAVTSIVKSLREQINQKPATDPITEAKNKVLRMQELKRAQQLKIMDSAIAAKVPRVTKLPPLKDIVKDKYYIENEAEQETAPKLHSDYEEIIIVSASSNTEISIPPLNVLPVHTNSRSLLKSSALLFNISNNVQPSSLIASIQDVVVQKVASPSNNSTAKVQASVPRKDKEEQHGEDKVIMHLRKDRIRPPTSTIATQTGPHPAFPKLICATDSTTQKNKYAHRGYRNRETNTTKSGASSGSDSETVRGRSRSRSCSRGQSQSRRATATSPCYRSRSRSADSCTSSVERVRHCDTAGGYSSRSSRRHRSSISSSYSESERKLRGRRQRRTSYKQRSKKYSRSSSASSSSSESDYSGRSRSPYYRRSRSRSRSRSMSRSQSRRRGAYNGNNNFVDRNVSQPAVEERRIVYVGRIEQETTKEMLRRKFLKYGNIKQITIHYKETGMKYGFVTYERSQDAFTVIDSSTRDPTISMYDISFGGRRAFCRASYADLDNAGINTYHSFVFPRVEAAPKEDDSFEALLQKVKAKMSANKTTSNNSSTPNSDKA